MLALAVFFLIFSLVLLVFLIIFSYCFFTGGVASALSFFYSSLPYVVPVLLIIFSVSGVVFSFLQVLKIKR